MFESATFFYEGRLAEDGTVFDERPSNPHTIRFGRSQVMPKIEQALEQMDVGETREVFIKAEDGYGLWDEAKVETALISDIPNGADLPVGEYINWHSPASLNPIPVKIRSKKNGVVEMDFNHPLAGQDLIYTIELAGRG